MLLILRHLWITLNGDTQITVEVGTTYTDLGATASDNYDGDITADIVTVNNDSSGNAASEVTRTVIGSYTVTYNVSDDAGDITADYRGDIGDTTYNVTDTTAGYM